ncbi:MAG: peptide chain release factor N(5)-glutamine methyltransferase [Phycisphaerae bacterium]|nr:peptide chain release factor N(5)-glutamine methyltransferase [Phycisphaerae bacterium]
MTQQVEIWTVRRLLDWTTPFFQRKDVDAPRLSAEMLLSHVLKVPRLQLYVQHERELTAEQLSAFRGLVKRASDQEPIAYLTGVAPFFNLEFKVTPAVLIPRPDSETIVENVLQLARHEVGFSNPRILDLCTGSGCIAAAIASHLKNLDSVIASDLSPAAVEVARQNFASLELSDRITVVEGDLFEALKHASDHRPFDLITANPPYIRSNLIPELDASVKNFEPHLALDGGEDGLAIHRRILSAAPDRLVPGGRVYLEIAYDQGDAARALAATFPAYTEVKILRDYAGNDRVLYLRKTM